MQNMKSTLFDYWNKQQPELLQPPATSINIEAFETSFQVHMPSSFKDYLKIANGFNQTKFYQDKNGFNFWPIDKMVLLSNYSKSDFFDPRNSAYVIFCDYLDFSWGYAINMKGTSEEIIFVGTDHNKVVAQSFKDFIEMYIADSEDLYNFQ